MVKSKGERVFDVCNIGIMVLLTIMFVYPIGLIVAGSFTDGTALTKYGFSIIIRKFSISSYTYIFKAQDLFLRSMLNSFFITGSCVVLMTLTTSLYAYAVTRKQLEFRGFFNFVLVIPMLFAGGTIPYYLLINDLGLMNSLWAIILPSSVSAWYILMVKNFFAALPESLTEAAQLEGANNMQVLFKVVMPLGFPIIATIILYTAVATWNDWFQASLFLDSSHQHLWPIQRVIRSLNENIENLSNFIGGGSTAGLNGEGIKMAAVVLSTLPIVMVYPFLQRFFIGGVLVGSVKE